MTLKEAARAAQELRRIRYAGTEYERIYEVALLFDDDGKNYGIVELLDKNRNCLVSADPAKIELA